MRMCNVKLHKWETEDIYCKFDGQVARDLSRICGSVVPRYVSIQRHQHSGGTYEALHLNVWNSWPGPTTEKQALVGQHAAAELDRCMHTPTRGPVTPATYV